VGGFQGGLDRLGQVRVHGVQIDRVLEAGGEARSPVTIA
jgi:hypothetical protein